MLSNSPLDVFEALENYRLREKIEEAKERLCGNREGKTEKQLKLEKNLKN